ncbi:YicC/YloC family endoribonuclease [Anaerosinus massiliensis]|uniref:YicC/YloC family endoribonuclease n=1 Tax=Massilibacillus massiliensis TaxID=1806837 RepID=UPI000A777472|nr:YicC/YloC family endoribonuclease [Massilibacillus massiliensis]
MQSMTGFGFGEYLDSESKFTVEIKTVNHRYSDLIIRMPPTLNSLEDKIRKFISSKLYRGRVDLFISWEEYKNTYTKIKVDKDLAIAYHSALRELSTALKLQEPENVHDIAKYQNVLYFEEITANTASLWDKLKDALDIAVHHLKDMRTVEGENIFKDLIDRIHKLNLLVDHIEERAPIVIEIYHQNLLEKIKDLLVPIGGNIDEVRLVQETALFAEKTNFTEEVVRLRSHLAQFRETMLISEESIGRKLDFITQEMNREANTIASKANDFTIANYIVDIKSQIEKVREQVQNIE